MRRPTLKLLLVVAAILSLLQTKAASALAVVPEYRIGETAKVDVVAFVPIVAIDPEKTRELKAKQAQRPSAIYRVNTNATAEVLAHLRSAFATNRDNFLAAVENAYQQRKLDEATVSTEQFRQLATSFQSTNNAFPLTLPLASVWARHEPDDQYIAPFEKRLASVMARYIRPDRLPNEAKVNDRAKLVFSNATQPLTLADAERSRTRELRTNILALRFAETNLAKEFSSEETASAKFAVSLLQPNCFPEVELTLAVRDHFTENLSSVSHFGAGEVIVRAGEVIDAKAKAALDELRARTAMLILREQPLAIPATRSYTREWVFGIAAVSAVLIALLWLWQRHRRTMSLAIVPESLGHEAVAALRADPVIRARLVEHVTRLVGSSVVRRLLAQRGQLLNVQHAAAAQAIDLEQRLEKVRSEVGDRFTAYDQRITELEKELTAAEEQNRDLILAKIALAKQELEEERGRLRNGKRPSRARRLRS